MYGNMTVMTSNTHTLCASISLHGSNIPTPHGATANFSCVFEFSIVFGSLRNLQTLHKCKHSIAQALLLTPGSPGEPGNEAKHSNSH